MSTHPTPPPRLTHIDSHGAAQMVNIGAKDVTERRAVAEARVRCSPELLAQVTANRLAKGNLIEVARLAGIQAAKRTSHLIPLCHQVPLDVVEVEIEQQTDALRVRATAVAQWKTGVEMEALTAAAVASLTVIDMGKAVDRSMEIEHIRLIEKTGGRRGDWRRQDSE